MPKKNNSASEHFWKFRCWKSARRCGKAHFEVKMLNTLHVRTTFGRSDVLSRGRRKGLCTLPKVSKTWGFCAFPKNDDRRCKDAFRVEGGGQETCSSEMLGGQGADFLRGVPFWSIRSSGLLRWFCVTGAALRMTWHHFSCQAQHFRQMEWKKRKTHWHEAVSSAFNFPFLNQVLQNCLVFDVVKFKNWRGLAELLPFWRCQVQKLRKSRWIASFLTLSSSKIEEVSQNCCNFDAVRFKIWRSRAEQLRFQTYRKTGR